MDGTLKWKLHKYTGSKTGAAEDAEAQEAVQPDTADEAFTVEAANEAEDASADTASDTVQEQHQKQTLRKLQRTMRMQLEIQIIILQQTD